MLRLVPCYKGHLAMQPKHQGSQQLAEERTRAGQPETTNAPAADPFKAAKFLASIDEALRKVTGYYAALELEDPARKELARMIKALRQSRAALIRGDSQWSSFISSFWEFLGDGSGQSI